MEADVFLNRSESGSVEISVVKHGLSSGAARKYDTRDKAREVLLAFRMDAAMVDRQFEILSRMRPSELVRLPTIDIANDVLESLGFRAAAFIAA